MSKPPSDLPLLELKLPGVDPRTCPARVYLARLRYGDLTTYSVVEKRSNGSFVCNDDVHRTDVSAFVVAVWELPER